MTSTNTITTNTAKNVLLENKFHTPFESIPFDKIKVSHFLPALEELISNAKNEINKIKSSSEKANFKNTIEALDISSRKISQISNIFFALHSAESNDELRDIAQKFSPMLAEYQNDISLDEDLFKKVLLVKDSYDASGVDKDTQNKLSTEELRLLTEIYDDFTRNGALLSAEKKKKVREIDQKLSKLSLNFSENVLKTTNEFLLIVENKDELAGLPQRSIDTALEAAKTKGHEGKYVFTLDAPCYTSFMKYANNRLLREKMYRALASRGFVNGKYDNKGIILEVVKLRHERANILGYETHADFVLSKRMAQNKDNVFEFLNNLLAKAKPIANKEIEELNAFKEKENLVGQDERLEPWDYSFYAEKLKKAKFDIDDEILRPYFRLDNVIEGFFNLANKLYNLKFIELKNVPLYHQDVKVYEVFDEKKNQHIGLFYADFFPRDGKRNGAWMTSLKDQFIDNTDLLNRHDHRPHVSIVCNFTKPTATTPSLLSLNEVLTFYHEFGHALHGLLSECTYSQLSGTNVYWDFVELPSQIMENWVYERENLDSFARHFETGEQIPIDVVNKIKESSKFHEGYITLRQLSFGFLDMSWHSVDPRNICDIINYELKAVKETQVLPSVEGSCISTAFSHIFAGGYSSGYYSYKWAEVLDADAFEYFKEKGIFNKEAAKKFRENILEKGGTEHPMELYVRFRGKEPSVEALLRRGGLF
ncbi:MAG: M3 family metallopeptidase [Oligoflexia bacterium]|nr:M3 family metallopeptidase [Oligoflexia bacterium]